MSHIQFNSDLPGILGPMTFSPDTAAPLNALANALLHAPSSLTRGERELIATYVSSLNDCHFCQSSHAAVAAAHLGDNLSITQQVRRNFRTAPISQKLKALLTVAGQVQKGGKHVTPEAISDAKAEGATDRELHDTVLIAAAFCMYNRYVDGLATWAPAEAEAYASMGKDLAQNGYRVVGGR